MKRAEPFEIFACPAKRNIGGNHFLNIRSVVQILYIFPADGRISSLPSPNFHYLSIVVVISALLDCNACKDSRGGDEYYSADNGDAENQGRIKRLFLLLRSGSRDYLAGLIFLIGIELGIIR